MKGITHSSFSLCAAPELWLVVLGASGCIGLVLAFLLLMPEIRAFSFDRSTRMLTYTESGFGRNPLAVPVRFERITSVRACLPTTCESAGYFEVCVDKGNGGIRSIRLGGHIPIETLRQHLDWLRQEIPEHIESTLQLDT